MTIKNTDPPISRLLIFRTTLSQGGADRVAVTLLQILDRNRFRPTLLLMRREGCYLDDIPTDVEVHSLQAKRLWYAVPAMVRALKTLRPDVVFSLDSGGNILLVIARALAGIETRLVLSERNVLIHGPLTINRLIQIAFKRLLYRHAELVTAVSEAVAVDMQHKLQLSRNKVLVVFNPVVGPEIIHAAKAEVQHPWFLEPIPIILSAGRLVAQKDHATLLRAFAEITARQKARLFILGDGPLKEVLQQQAEDLGVADNTCFAGFDKNPFRYMARASVFVLPSLQEGLPGALIQAMACGTACVATDCHGGSAEIISRPGSNGLLVPVGNSSAIAEAVSGLLNDPVKRALIAREGRESVRRFTIDASMANYLEAIEGSTASSAV